MEIATENLASNSEHWASIDGYRNYEVSWFGRVRKIDTSRILKNSLNKSGYFVVGLSKNKKQKTHYIHQLVAREWVSNPEEKRCVDHIDGNRANNHHENLRYATHAENSRNMKNTQTVRVSTKEFTCVIGGINGWHPYTPIWDTSIWACSQTSEKPQSPIT